MSRPKYIKAQPRHTHLVWLMPDEGTAKRLSQTNANPEQALAFGLVMAGRLYPGKPVEVAVVHSGTFELEANTRTGETE